MEGKEVTYSLEITTLQESYRWYTTLVDIDL